MRRLVVDLILRPDPGRPTGEPYDFQNVPDPWGQGVCECCDFFLRIVYTIHITNIKQTTRPTEREHLRERAITGSLTRIFFELYGISLEAKPIGMNVGFAHLFL